ncbi:hypothetical protein L7F22_033269 [Adiantum nelumboides]|nr:hypothetical protein [Adiantum nelumboides]MCO5579414.1 hypothetical protein [Adiantum nelumboides]
MGSSKTSFGVMGLCAFMTMMMIMAGRVAGQGPALAPTSGSDCDSVVLQLVDCLGYVTGSDATPPATCCTNLSAIIQSTPQCLCQLYNTTFTEPLGVNLTRAMQLPPACKLTTPDPSLCALIGIPIPGPTSGPMSPGSVPPSVTPSPPVLTPVTAPDTELQPSSNSSSPPSPNGNSAFALEARTVAVASFWLFALTFFFY